MGRNFWAGWFGLLPKLVQLTHEAELRLLVERFAQHHERCAPLQCLQSNRAVDENHAGRVLGKNGGIPFNHVVDSLGNTQLMGQPGNKFTMPRTTTYLRVLPENQLSVRRSMLCKRVNDTNNEFSVIGKVAVVHDLRIAVVLKGHKVIRLAGFLREELLLKAVAGEQVLKLTQP